MGLSPTESLTALRPHDGDCDDGVDDDMEKYKYMLGQAHAYEYISQEISNLLYKKEQKNEQGTVIDLEKRGPKA